MLFFDVVHMLFQTVLNVFIRKSTDFHSFDILLILIDIFFYFKRTHEEFQTLVVILLIISRVNNSFNVQLFVVHMLFFKRFF